MGSQFFTSKVYKLAFLAIVLVANAACNRPNHPAQEYLERLNSVLDTQIQADPIAYPVFPTVRDLQIPVQEYSISIREFLSLRGCKLHDSIAQRNTQLGKVASSSQLLLNDLEIIDTAPKCINSKGGAKTKEKLSGELKDKLIVYFGAKKAFLPKRFWHAVLASSEYREFWRQSNFDSAVPFVASGESVKTSITRLKTYSEHLALQPNLIESKTLEESLAALRFGDGGRLLSELLIQLSYLSAADKAIKQKLALSNKGKKLCLSAKPNTKAKYFQNVVNKFFIQKVQSRAVMLNREYNVLMPELLAMEAQLADSATDAFIEWQAARQKIMQNALNSIKTHALNIQKLYQECGLAVGLKAS